MAKRWCTGPWKLGDIRTTGSGAQRVYINANLHQALADVVWKMEGDTRSLQQESNAKLIVASPELYDALENIVNAYTFNKPLNDSLAEARALIKRLGE